MAQERDFNKIDQKWQQYWHDHQTFKVDIDHQRPKFYSLDMFPYPSGSGLHVGHPLGYIASDIVCRYKRTQGYNVLHPMGWDAFGLPAEQYAIQTGQHPATTTTNNIKRFKEQLCRIGFSFDWSREVSTADPNYYKWTQWTVTQLFNYWYDKNTQKARPIKELIHHFETYGTNDISPSETTEISFSASEWNAKSETEQYELLYNYRLLYLDDAVVNWCPALGTVLANDEVKDGYSERGNHPVEQKKMKQWVLRVGAYAERLLKNLTLLDWPEAIKTAQKNWIGKSQGASIHFSVENNPNTIEVFTTRPETIFGSTFLVLAPEHPLVSQLTTAEQQNTIKEYQEKTQLISERDRLSNVERISGAFTGSYALHPFTHKKIPIWISDYVLLHYGTGAIMAVPAHDGRDYSFAHHFSLPIIEVISGGNIEQEAHEGKTGTLINSDFLNDLSPATASKKIIDEIKKNNLGKAVVKYRLRDAIFARQRYWGEPMPIEYAKQMATPLPLEELPLTLPSVDKYLPTETGEPPLGRAKNWESPRKNNYDLHTMPGYAGSSAYFLRYMDPHNSKELVSQKANNYWQNVDLYIGGKEHATGHLIYSRFWNMFLYDLGLICQEEPFKKLINQGIISGNSHFVYRIKNENTFVSHGLKDQYDTAPLHVEVSFVKNGVLDLEKFKQWRTEFNDAKFILEEGNYLCGQATEKMSKSYFNAVNPDHVIEEYGADTLRLYEIFLGPLHQSKPWKNDGIQGVHRFLKKTWSFYLNNQENFHENQPSIEELKIIHPLLKKVSSEIEQVLSMNTAISALMVGLSSLQKLDFTLSKWTLKSYLLCLAPFAPHLAEELWSNLGHHTSIIHASFPPIEEQYLQTGEITLPVSLNGKKKFVLQTVKDQEEKIIQELVLNDERMKKILDEKKIKKFIYVKNRIVNIVV